jgi:phage shock protein C
MKNATVGPFRSRKGLILGVIRGLADHWGISALFLRLVVVGLAVLLTFWPVVLVYIAAAIFMPTERHYEFG